MRKTFTKEYMINNKGCYSTMRLMTRSFMKEEQITLQAILESEISLKDKYWFVCNKLATQEQNQQIAIGAAEIVLEIFENKYPGDPRPREAIQAAKDYLAGTIDRDILNAKRSAVYADADANAVDAASASAAAYAAYTAAANAVDAIAYSAADDAGAAATAAYAAAAYAADAAYAAGAAVYAAAAAYVAADADAAADAAFNSRLLSFLVDFVNTIPES